MITGRTSNAALALLPLLCVLSCGAEDEPALVSPSKSGKPRAVAPSQNPGKRAASDREVDNLLKQADEMALAGNSGCWIHRPSTYLEGNKASRPA